MVGADWIRLGFCLSTLLVCAWWEYCVPGRALQQARGLRWRVNLSLATLTVLCVRFSVGALAMQAAVVAHTQQWGLWSLMALPTWGNIVLSVVLLDAALYVQHVACHRVPWLWRLHLVHHTDRDVDVSTGLRFHPLEIVLSLVYKALLVACLGAHPMAVLVFEVWLNATALFTHSNIQLSTRVTRMLRSVCMTPELHCIHHSIHACEMQSNFGFSVPWWDYLCGTYRGHASVASAALSLGVAAYQTAMPLRLADLVCLPFRPSLDDVTPTE